MKYETLLCFLRVRRFFQINYKTLENKFHSLYLLGLLLLLLLVTSLQDFLQHLLVLGLESQQLTMENSNRSNPKHHHQNHL